MAFCTGSTGDGGSGSGGEGTNTSNGQKWTLGKHKSAQKWANQMAKRGWTPQQIDQAVKHGQRFPAVNDINPDNPATRYVNPTTGRSVVMDNVTHEILQVGRDDFNY